MLELIKELWVFIRTGNPNPDSTSFCGWLRVFLAAASAMPAREAALMEELAQHQPDLYIIHTGHNESLEKRSYGRLADLPAPLLKLGGHFAEEDGAKIHADSAFRSEKEASLNFNCAVQFQ